MPKLNVLVAGSTVYIGIQLLKLLVKHKYVKIRYLCGSSSIGKKVSSYDKSISLKKLPKIVKFKKEYLKKVDIIFTALPNGEAQIISKHLTNDNVLIDLAADFRLQKASDYLKWYKQKHKAVNNIKHSIYSLPEITGKKVKDHKIIACPGCYPTSILLPLIPLLKKGLIKKDNIILAIPSNGIHSNGYSLVRSILKKNNLPQYLKKEILRPTKIYSKEILNLTKKNLINSAAHITGGGLIENLTRSIPKNFTLNIDLSKIKIIEIFKWLKSKNISDQEMLRTFNCGVGFCLIVSKKNVKKIKKIFTRQFMPYEIGYISEEKNKVNLSNSLKW